MNPLESRIGVYLAPDDSLWFGAVLSYNSTTFVLTVSTTAGSLSNIQPGHAVVRFSTDQWARVKSVNPGAGTISLAENPIEFLATNSVVVYNVFLPFPRYQRVTPGGVIYKDYDIVKNPEGYFGENQLQYVPKKK